MKRIGTVWLLSAIVLATTNVSAQCPAGGYPPPAPPYTVPGGGDPSYNGPVGSTPGVPPPPLNPNPGGGTTPAPVTGGTTPTPPRGGVTSRNPGTGRKTRPNPGGRTNPKRARNPWSDRIGISWRAVFPPIDSKQGYDASIASLREGVARPAAAGGWERNETPSLVLVYDPSDSEHLKAILALRRDARFTAATWVFNCFKVDARQLDKRQRQLRLAVFEKNGELVREFDGKNLRKAFRAMETAYKNATRRELSKVLPHLHRNVGGIAYCKEKIAWLEKRIVCHDCGKTHKTPETIARFKKDMGRYEEALASFRK